MTKRFYYTTIITIITATSIFAVWMVSTDRYYSPIAFGLIVFIAFAVVYYIHRYYRVLHCSVPVMAHIVNVTP